jgi:hypothetical protein
MDIFDWREDMTEKEIRQRMWSLTTALAGIRAEVAYEGEQAIEYVVTHPLDLWATCQFMKKSKCEA